MPNLPQAPEFPTASEADQPNRAPAPEITREERTTADAMRFALRRGLLADGSLTALLGGPHVTLHPDDDQALPYVHIEDAIAVTSLPGGAELHVLRIVARQESGRREALVLSGAILGALVDAEIAAPDRGLVTARFGTADIRRDGGRAFLITIRCELLVAPLQEAA
jgi:uncharacterized protein DUF3168